MSNIVGAVFSFFIKAIFFAAMIFVPVFIVIFIFATWQTAKLYSIDVALLIGLSYGIYDTDSHASDFVVLKTVVVCFVVSIIAVLAHTGLIVYQQRQLSALPPNYKSAQYKAPNAHERSCYSIGEEYGRAKAYGKHIMLDIPERCINDSLTNRGITDGIKMELQK